MKRLVGLFLLLIPATTLASERACSDVRDASQDLEPFESLLEKEELDSRSAKALKTSAISIEDVGALLAEDEEVSAEERELGERLASAAQGLQAALEAETAAKSAFHRVVECLDELSDACSLRD